MGVVPVITNKTVASAGTRVRLFSSVTYAVSAYFEGLDTNTGSIYLGNSTVSSTSYMKKIGAATGFSLNALPDSQAGPDGGMLDLSQLYIDATTASQVLLVSYLLHIGPA